MAISCNSYWHNIYRGLARMNGYYGNGYLVFEKKIHGKFEFNDYSGNYPRLKYSRKYN